MVTAKNASGASKRNASSRSAVPGTRAQQRRQKAHDIRRRRANRMLFGVFVTVVMAGVIIESVKIAQLVSVNRKIRLIAGENQVLEDRLFSLSEELRLETREDVIRYHAEKSLGMLTPSTASFYAMAVPNKDNHPQTANIP